MVTVTKGAVKFNSIKDAAKAHNIPYITLYMRLRMGMSLPQAVAKPIRKYDKKAS